MSNNRVFYAVQYPAFGAYQTGVFTRAKGVQSVGMTTNFNIDTIFELGQLDTYDILETVPQIEATVEKVLDGAPLVYHLATSTATSATLLNRTNQRCDMVLSIFSDAQDNASGTPISQALCSGLFIQSLNYQLPIDGNFTESVTFVGNDKLWRTSGFYFNGGFDGTDSAPSGVQRRQNVIMGSGGSIWPTDIAGLDGQGYNTITGGNQAVHFQSVNIQTNLNRNDLFELGRRRQFYRFAQFPVEVTCEIGVLSAGSTPGDLVNAVGDSTSNTANRTIKIKLSDTTVFDLGTKNRLSTINYSGGDTGGGAQILTYSYKNFNFLKITQNNDPAGLS